MIPFLLIAIIPLVLCDNNKLPHEIEPIHKLSNNATKIQNNPNLTKATLVSEGGPVATQRPLIDLLRINPALLSLDNEMGKTKKKPSVPRKEAGVYVPEVTTLPSTKQHAKLLPTAINLHNNNINQSNNASRLHNNITNLHSNITNMPNNITNQTNNITNHTNNITNQPNVTNQDNIVMKNLSNKAMPTHENKTEKNLITNKSTIQSTARLTTDVANKNMSISISNKTETKHVNNTTKQPKMKPTIVSYENLVNSYNNHSKADSHNKGNIASIHNIKISNNVQQSDNPEMIMPIVITVLVVPVFLVLSFMAFRRGRDAWRNRHYKRMDFLLDGMYND